MVVEVNMISVLVEVDCRRLIKCSILVFVWICSSVKIVFNDVLVVYVWNWVFDFDFIVVNSYWEII